MQEQGDAGQPSGGGDADAVQAAGGSGPAPAAAPTQRARRARRRGKAAAPPPPPSDLEVVQAAVAADPARTEDLKRSSAMWQYRISAKNLQAWRAGQAESPCLRLLQDPALLVCLAVARCHLRISLHSPPTRGFMQGVEPHLGRWNAARIWQLDARAAAWRK